MVTNGNINKNTTLLILDIDKAFESVWVDGLIHKLVQYNIPLMLTRVIALFVSNRKFKVKINGTFSKTTEATAGVRKVVPRLVKQIIRKNERKNLTHNIGVTPHHQNY